MPNTVTIQILNGVAGTTHVEPGDHVQWTANVVSYVIPPVIFAGNECKSQFSVPGDGTPAPTKACHVNGRPGPHSYTCGVGAAAADTYSHRVESGSDVIIIDTAKPKS